MSNDNHSGSETADLSHKEQEKRDEQFNVVISAAVTVLATLLGIFNVKDGNITQAMSQAQSETVNYWSYYQAKSTKQHLAENTLSLMRLEQFNTGGSAAFNTALEEEIAALRAKIEVLNKEKGEIKVRAETYQENYKNLNYRDDQFDIAEAGMGIAIAMLGISSLTRSRWLAVVAGLFGLLGTLSGVAGFFELPFRLGIVAEWLS